MSFVTLTKGQFEDALPEGWTEVDDSRSKEYIYQVPTPRPTVAVRVYSTVDKRDGVTRDVGADAIRIVHWDTVNDRPVGKGRKILRVEGATTIQDRIAQRIQSFLDAVEGVEIIDFSYVKAVLHANQWSDFACSLLEQLEDRGHLTDKQLAYVLGDENPKGKPTFESRAKKKSPHFVEKYLEDLEEGEEDESGGSQGRTLEKGDESPLEPEEAPDKPPRETPAVPPVPTSGYGAWSYGFKNFNPVQSQVYPHISEDANMVIGANTSAGKTVCAELLMDYVLAQGQRVIYLSPLKALTQEKYDDWQKRFPEERITILTGDYTLSEKMKQQLGASGIIVMTSEMADSRTRRMESEKNYWLKEVGLVIVDESHILSTERGHAVETGIMRFTKINPKARILFLSATMPNVKELGDWLTTLNSKPTTVIYNTWRPVKLQMSFCEYPLRFNNWGREDYWASQEAKRGMAVEIAMSKPSEKFLIFCHDKGTGRDIVRRLREVGEEAKFHNADLDLNERLEVEKKFQDRENGIRVMVSTSTLAWGRNLPARNVVIVGVHRGISEVDELDIIQMAGRAGRYGIDDAGFVYLIIPEGSAEAWRRVFASPRPVTSVLNNRYTLAFHVLAEISNKEVLSKEDLLRWYERSLAYRQGIMPFSREDAEGLMQDLLEMEMIGYKGLIPYITGLGKVSAWLYFSPYDVYAWYRNFSRAFEIGLDDLTLAWALGDIPSNDMGYIPNDVKTDVEEMMWKLRNRGITNVSDACTVSYGAYHSLKGLDPEEGVLKAICRGLIFDIQRQTQAFSLMDGMYAKWGQDGLWKVLPVRIKYGIPEEIVPLTTIAGVGGKRAKAIWGQGLKSVEDVADLKNKKKLMKVLTPVVASKIQRAAKELLHSTQQQ